MYGACSFFSQFAIKRSQANQFSEPHLGKLTMPPQAGYGPSPVFLDDNLALSQQHKQDIEPDTSCPGPDDPTDFMGRLLELGSVVELLKTLYRRQGDDVRISSGWRGVIIKIDGAGDVLADFGEGRDKKWIRRKHLGTLRLLEEEELEQCCGTPEANNSLYMSEMTSQTLLKDWNP